MNIKEIHRVYFIGIGGIGMSALAHYFLALGKLVAGYDKRISPIVEGLMSKEVEVHFEDDVSAIPTVFLDKKHTLIVYTPAVSENHQELIYFKVNGFNVMKRAAVLGLITRSTFCLAVAGTHGKTTTSSILGHIMESEGATSFLGGVSENYKSNLILGGSKVSVVEADEFDRSFLQLAPNIACITSMDADHLDIYGGHSALIDSFKSFIDKVSDKVIVAKELNIPGLTYAIGQEADYQVLNLIIEKGVYIFDVKTPKLIIENVVLHLPGKHNVMNATAALAMADQYGIPVSVIKERLKTFKGVERRFSYRLRSEKRVLIDDYAHHPTELRSVCETVREMYPGEKVLAVFQPHLFTRTQDFADDFAKELSGFDEVLLLDIYPARELPIKGVTSSWLLNKMTLNTKKLTTKETIVSDVKKSKAKIVLMLGAGDIGLLVHKVKKVLVLD